MQQRLAEYDIPRFIRYSFQDAIYMLRYDIKRFVCLQDHVKLNRDRDQGFIAI